jgi:hypothetical protein
MTSYNKIFEAFAKKVNDLKWIDLSDQDIIEMTKDLMDSAIPKFLTCVTDLSDRDDETQQFTNDLLPLEIEIIAYMMVAEWLEPQINSTELTAQFFGSDKEKWTSQSTQLAKLKERQHEVEIKAPKLMNEYKIVSYVKTKMT